MNEKSSIALIGFMATGKTTVGKLLAKRLDKNFVETDEMIQKCTRKTIPEIFREEGEEKFRKYEYEVCRKVSKREGIVISCGGGIVLNDKNVFNLKQNCIIILLEASIKEIFRRIMKNNKEARPVVNEKNPKKTIKAILAKRQPLYESAADITINTTNKKLGVIIDEIIGELTKF
jgi:shikimate kinase